jgi:hypothetical protein
VETLVRIQKTLERAGIVFIAADELGRPSRGLHEFPQARASDDGTAVYPLFWIFSGSFSFGR